MGLKRRTMNDYSVRPDMQISQPVLRARKQKAVRALLFCVIFCCGMALPFLAELLPGKQRQASSLNQHGKGVPSERLWRVPRWYDDGAFYAKHEKKRPYVRTECDYRDTDRLVDGASADENELTRFITYRRYTVDFRDKESMYRPPPGPPEAVLLFFDDTVDGFWRKHRKEIMKEVLLDREGEAHRALTESLNQGLGEDAVRHIQFRLVERTPPNME